MHFCTWNKLNKHYNCSMVTRAAKTKISTWGVRENFNDSDSALIFCSLIVTVYATNVCEHHTWQSKWSNISTKQNRGYSEQLQRTRFHTYTYLMFLHKGFALQTCNGFDWLVHIWHSYSPIWLEQVSGNSK